MLNEFLREGWGKQEGGSQSLEKRNTYLLYPEVFCSHPCVIQVQKYLVGFHSRSHKLEEKTVVRTNFPCESLRFAQETHIGMGCPRCLSISYIEGPRKVIYGAKQRGTIIKTASELQKNMFGECKRGVKSPTKRLGAITAAAMPMGQGLYRNVRHGTPCRVIVAVFPTL